MFDPSHSPKETRIFAEGPSRFGLICASVESPSMPEYLRLWQRGHSACGNRRRKLQPVFCKRAPTYYGDHWAGGLMAMTEAEKLSRSVMERTFYAKLGPTPGFPSGPAAQTEQGKPTK
jgi:hypothetical protein